MKYGYCVSMIADDPAGVGGGRIDMLRRAGFDYAELPVAQMMALDEAAFEANVLEPLARAGMACLACNNFFPASQRLTGDEADHARALEYAGRAFQRMKRLGARKVVFGSSGARNVPLGFPRDRALEQLASLLKRLAGLAGAAGMQIVIEPLNLLESNVLNTFEAGVQMAARVDDPRVQALADTYHMRMVGEPFDALLRADGRLRHVHLARALGRSLPRPGDEEDYPAIFGALRAIGYDDTLSIEAYAGDDCTAAELGEALAFLQSMEREARERAG